MYLSLVEPRRKHWVSTDERKRGNVCILSLGLALILCKCGPCMCYPGQFPPFTWTWLLTSSIHIMGIECMHGAAHVQCSWASNQSINQQSSSSFIHSYSPFPCFLFQIYSAWETDEVIVFELWRNLALAMVCVFVITLILLADFKICLMVSNCYAILNDPSLF